MGKPLTAASKVFVTGCSGFLGRWLCDELLDLGHEVYGLDIKLSPGCSERLNQFYHHDLRLPLLGAIPDFDFVIHLASGAGGFLKNAHDSSLVDSEQQMLRQVKEIHVKSKAKRLIYTSSVNVFEATGVQNEGPLTVFDQKTPYAQAKAEAERTIQNEFDRFSILRPTNYFGPFQVRQSDTFGESHVIPDLIDKIQTQNVLEVFGDGTQIRNFIHLSDVSDFIIRSLDSEDSSFTHLRSGLFLTIKDLALQLLTLLKSEKEIRFSPQYLRYEPFPISNFPMESALQRGWEPQVSSLKEGLEFFRTKKYPPAIPSKASHKLQGTIEP
jgi:UDP-glucose 4-epimerase